MVDPRKFACVCVCAGAWVCVLWLADARARRCHLAQTPYRSPSPPPKKPAPMSAAGLVSRPLGVVSVVPCPSRLCRATITCGQIVRSSPELCRPRP